jgi:CRP-like cAMP-binding protein
VLVDRNPAGIPIPPRSVLPFDSSAFLADPELLVALCKLALPLDCSTERMLFRQGDAPEGLCILVSGEVTLNMAAPGGGDVFSVPAQPGSLLGLPALIGNQPYTLTATAHTGAQIGFLPREALMDLMRTDSAVSLQILKVLAAEVRSARRAIS